VLIYLCLFVEVYSLNQGITEVGQLIKAWRNSRGLSQLDLGLTANVSARHICFLETGRSQPSRETLLAIASGLDIPARQVNVLLGAAGFPAQYRQSNLSDPEMLAVREALEFMMEKHQPYPAMAVGTQNEIIVANTALVKLIDIIVAEVGELPERDRLYHPDGFRRCITNWEEVVSLFLRRLQREVIQGRSDAKETLERVLSYPGLPTGWQQESPVMSIDPMVKMNCRLGEHQLSFFSMTSTFGTAVDITMQEIKIESIFAADDVTKLFCMEYLQ
jgi:transcriptional regulator with XRE-family HTH domain